MWRTVEGRYVGDGHLDAVVLVAGVDDDRPADFDEDDFEPGPTAPDWADAEPLVVAEVAPPDVPAEATTVAVGASVEGVTAEPREPGVQVDGQGLPPAIEKAPVEVKPSKPAAAKKAAAPAKKAATKATKAAAKTASK